MKFKSYKCAVPENYFSIKETYVLNVFDKTLKSDSMGNLLCQMSPGSGVLSSIRLSYTKDVPHGRDAGLEIQLRWLSQEGLKDQKKTWWDAIHKTLTAVTSGHCLLTVYRGYFRPVLILPFYFSPCFNFALLHQKTISPNLIFSQNRCISNQKHEKRKFGLF